MPNTETDQLRDIEALERVELFADLDGWFGANEIGAEGGVFVSQST